MIAERQARETGFELFARPGLTSQPMEEAEISAHIEVHRFTRGYSVQARGRNVFVAILPEKIIVSHDEKRLFSKTSRSTLETIHLHTVLAIVTRIRIEKVVGDMRIFKDWVTLILRGEGSRNTRDLRFRKPMLAVQFLTRLIQRLPAKNALMPQVQEEVRSRGRSNHRDLMLIRRDGVTRLAELLDA